MRITYTILTLTLALLWSGCNEQVAATHPVFYLANQCRENGEYDAAAVQFRKYLTMRPNSPEGHLALASLYDENLNDSLRAIYHYQEYLKLAPPSTEATMVKQWLDDAVKRYQASLIPEEITSEIKEVKSSDDSEKLVAALKQQNQGLMRLIIEQRQEIATLKKSRPKVTPPKPLVAPPTNSQEYIVKSGDTLGLIARRFYGASSRFREIMQANGLTNTQLHIGQKLTIPPLKKE